MDQLTSNQLQILTSSNIEYYDSRNDDFATQDLEQLRETTKKLSNNIDISYMIGAKYLEINADGKYIVSASGTKLLNCMLKNSLKQSHIVYDNNAAPEFTTDVVYVVEANSNEQHQLWEKYHKQVEWVEISSGILLTVGHHYESPTCMSLRNAVLNGKRILFVDPTSMVVDHSLVKKWLDKFCNVERTDAQNFHNVIHCVSK